jgi:hypothetical protein
MIQDGREHVCSGCFQIIATHDPQAYQKGDFFYHSESHEDIHARRNWDAYLNGQRQETRAHLQKQTYLYAHETP